MLRNKTRTVTTKQALMADQTPVSSIFGSPRFINGGFPKKPSEIETITPSPTSILDTKQFSPIGYDHKIPSKNPNIFPRKKREWENKNPKRIGLALVDSLNEKPESSFTQSVTRKVLFGSKLEIQIPKIEFEPSTQTPKSPGDFGTKTRNSPFSKSPFGNSNFKSRNIFDISATEMELSEEYTRVIAHGPSPRTIHIYDDCVLESCNGVVGLSELKRQLSLPPPRKSSSGLESFLSFCCTCKKRLDQGKDIYMYRGEKGFCSHECRFKEMLSDGENNLKIN